MEPGSQLSDDVLRRALDAAPDGMLVVDGDGRIVFVNPMVEQLFGFAVDELLGTSVDLLLPQAARGAHADRRKEYGDHPRARAMGTGLELRACRRSGDEFPVEISLSPLHTDDGLLIVVIVRDVSARRAADAELQRVREELALVDDRERIARDLHDTVIQRLFAVGLSLQGALTRAKGNPVADRIQLAVDDIDVTIRDIRSSIFALHTRRPFGESMRDDVLLVAREAARVLGFEPTVAFDGPIDSVVTEEVRENVIATLREALSNTTKHAHASSVSIVLVVEAGEVVLHVRDDGVGVDHPGVGNGLRNMHERAAALGGSCSVTSASRGSGTFVEWRVSTSAASPG
jgi:PAS domain S-box-containing protein